MSLDSKPGFHGSKRGVGIDFGRIEVEFFAPDQTRSLTLLDNHVKEATEELYPIASPDTREARMVRQWLSQIVAEIPADAESISRQLHQVSFRANPIKEHHQLQLKEHDRIDRGAATACVGLLSQRAHKGEIKGPFQVTIEMILGHQLFD